MDEGHTEGQNKRQNGNIQTERTHKQPNRTNTITKYRPTDRPTGRQNNTKERTNNTNK